jgi:Ca-activated chloride channel family protein
MRLPSPEILTAGVLILSAAAEVLHARRVHRIRFLAFGPSGSPPDFLRPVPYLRVAAVALLSWALASLWHLGTHRVKPPVLPHAGWRHLVIALDVSPSMQLRDAGPDRSQTRAKRASDLVQSALKRVALDQLRVSLVAFYTGAKPVAVDCQDPEVIRNALDDLPLEIAFEPGKTRLLDGIQESSALAKGWLPGSATLLVVSDGDTTPDQGLKPLPPAFSTALVVGVGDASSGRFIDGHQSRQDSATLRQLAARLRGTYHDGNVKHLPSGLLEDLAHGRELQEDTGSWRHRAARVALILGALLLVLVPIVLAAAGPRWRPAAPMARPKGTHPFFKSPHSPKPVPNLP